MSGGDRTQRADRRFPPRPSCSNRYLVSPMWAFGCGGRRLRLACPPDPLAAGGRRVLPAGPLVCATSQAVNDYLDRRRRAINELQHRFPWTCVSGRWGLYIAGLDGGLCSPWRSCSGPGAYGGGGRPRPAWAYSAPQLLRLKAQRLVGQRRPRSATRPRPGSPSAAVMAGARRRTRARSAYLPCSYSAGAHGHRDAQRLQSDRGRSPDGHRLAAGPRPGVPTARRARPARIISRRIAVVAPAPCVELPLACHRGRGVLVLVQAQMMCRFPPIARRATWYSGFGVPLCVRHDDQRFAVRSIFEGQHDQGGRRFGQPGGSDSVQAALARS